MEKMEEEMRYGDIERDRERGVEGREGGRGRGRKIGKVKRERK